MNILLTTDFSYGSLKASHYIINLFGVENHKYVLINSANVKYAGTTFYKDFLEEVDAFPRITIKKVSRELGEKFIGLKIESHAEIGGLINAIDRYTAKDDYAIIGLGANGSSNIYEKLIGSTALDVLEHCQIPITIVPVVTPIEPANKVMVAIGKTFESTKNQFINLVAQFTSQPTEMFLYHIGEENEISVDPLIIELTSEFPGMKISNTTNPTTGAAIENQILEYATINEIDLLFTSPKNHNLIQRLFSHSTTDNLVERTHIPMIALKV